MTTTTTTRPYPFLEVGVSQEYELHTLCGWGVVDQAGHEQRCACPRLIHVSATISHEVDPVDYWILEPASTQDQILDTRRWLGGYGVIVGGAIWAEALAQC